MNGPLGLLKRLLGGTDAPARRPVPRPKALPPPAALMKYQPPAARPGPPLMKREAAPVCLSPQPLPPQVPAGWVLVPRAQLAQMQARGRPVMPPPMVPPPVQAPVPAPPPRRRRRVVVEETEFIIEVDE